MNGIHLEIPMGAPTASGLPGQQLELELRHRLVASMHAGEVVGGPCGCMMPGLEKTEFHHWLCEGSKVRPLCSEDYELERRNLEEWLSG